MADTPELNVKVKADTTEAESAIERFGGKVAGAFGAYLSAKALISGIQAVTAAARESEASVQAFNLSLSSAGKFTEAASAAFQDYASKLEMTTGIQDDLILKNAALLVSVGKLSGDGLNKATKAALDLAAGLQIDVGSAFNIMAKAAEGNVMGLAKYGLEVRKGASDSEKFASALGFVNARFGDMASGNMKTFDGVMAKLGNGFEKVQESIGKLIIHDPKLKALFSVIADGFYAMAKSIDKAAEAGTFMSDLIDSMFAFGQGIVTWVLKPLEMIGNFLGTILVGRIAAFVSALAMVAPMFDRLFGTNYAPMLETMAMTWRTTAADMAQTALNFDTSSSQVISNGLTNAKNKVDELAKSMKENMKPAMAETGIESSTFWGELTTGFNTGFETITAGIETMKTATQQLGQQVKGTFSSGFSNAFAQMGKAIVEGQNVFGAFGKAILGMLGNVAMQMGTFFISMGIGFLFIDPGRGAGLIGAGIGLSLLGGILQALGGGGVGSGAAAAGGSGATATVDAGPSSQMTAMTTPEEREAKQQNFTFVVEGNVFDSRETGKRMIDVFAELSAETGAKLPREMVIG